MTAVLHIGTERRAVTGATPAELERKAEEAGARVYRWGGETFVKLQGEWVGLGNG